MRTFKRMTRAAAVAALMLAAAGAARAGQCESSFAVAGVPLVTGLTFSAEQDLPGVEAGSAVKRIARRMRADGYSGVAADPGRGRVDAWQETSGSGRTQHLRAAVTATGKGSRARITFTVRAGQVADDRVVRRELCKILRAGA